MNPRNCRLSISDFRLATSRPIGNRQSAIGNPSRFKAARRNQKSKESLHEPFRRTAGFSPLRRPPDQRVGDSDAPRQPRPLQDRSAHFFPNRRSAPTDVGGYGSRSQLPSESRRPSLSMKMTLTYSRFLTTLGLLFVTLASSPKTQAQLTNNWTVNFGQAAPPGAARGDFFNTVNFN